MGDVFDIFGGGSQKDELAEAMKELSKMLRTVYNEHLENGFTEEQALALVIGMQQAMMAGMAGMRDG